MEGDRQFFYQQFHQAFRTTGSVAPSSRWLARALCRYLPDGRQQGRPTCRWLEVGPGTGAVTDTMIRRLQPGDVLDLVEINGAFVERLQLRMTSDPAWQRVANQVRIFHMPVEQFQPDDRYDALVTGLPLNNFTAAEVAAIFDRFAQLVRSGCPVSYFEYIGIRRWKMGRGSPEQYSRLAALDRLLHSVLQTTRFERRTVWWNLLPAWVHFLRFPEGWKSPLVEAPEDPVSPTRITAQAKDAS